MGLFSLLPCFRPADKAVPEQHPQPKAEKINADGDQLGTGCSIQAALAQGPRPSAGSMDSAHSGQRLLLDGKTDWGSEKDAYKRRLCQFHEENTRKGTLPASARWSCCR